MTQDDVLFGYRLQLFDLVGRVGVSGACRTFGIHRPLDHGPNRLGASGNRCVSSGCAGLLFDLDVLTKTVTSVAVHQDRDVVIEVRFGEQRLRETLDLPGDVVGRHRAKLTEERP